MNMVERVARAIAAEMEGQSADSLWVNYEGVAQAAIKAMMEDGDAEYVWQAMIDAAIGKTS
jgi:hypothetical protein